jgi:hypothetical protein
MRRVDRKLAVDALCVGGVLLGPTAAGALAATVRIEAGTDARAAVNQRPAGTTFVFASGVHRLTTAITARSGDTFVGEFGAVVKGSKLLTPAEAVKSGSTYYFSGQTHAPNLSPYAINDLNIRDNNPQWTREVQYGNELFVGGQRARHVNTLAEVNAPGTWYFDDAADRIYVYDNPAGKTIETSVAKQAFKVGTASAAAVGVTIDNLYVQQFANNERGNGGAIGLDNADLTTIRRVETSFNHAAGITAGAGRATIENSRIADNGQIGVSTYRAQLTFRRNEVVGNNAVHFSANWEAGATKFAGSPGGLFEQNCARQHRLRLLVGHRQRRRRHPLEPEREEQRRRRGPRHLLRDQRRRRRADDEDLLEHDPRQRQRRRLHQQLVERRDVRERDLRQLPRHPGRRRQPPHQCRRVVPEQRRADRHPRQRHPRHRRQRYQVQLIGGANMQKSDIESMMGNVYRGVDRFSLNGAMTFAEWKELWSDVGSRPIRCIFRRPRRCRPCRRARRRSPSRLTARWCPSRRRSGRSASRRGRA